MDEKVVNDALTSPEVLALIEQVRQSAPALTHTLQRVEQLNRTGALDTMLDMVEVLHAAKSSMSDGMIGRMGSLVRVFGELGDAVVTSGLPEKVPALMQAAAEARKDAAADPATMGVFDLLRLLKQPEVQFGLKFMLAMSRRVPEALKE